MASIDPQLLSLNPEESYSDDEEVIERPRRAAAANVSKVVAAEKAALEDTDNDEAIAKIKPEDDGGEFYVSITAEKQAAAAEKTQKAAALMMGWEKVSKQLKQDLADGKGMGPPVVVSEPSSDNASMLDLPHEIWSNIFMRVTPKDMVNIAKVNEGLKSFIVEHVAIKYLKHHGYYQRITAAHKENPLACFYKIIADCCGDCGKSRSGMRKYGLDWVKMCEPCIASPRNKLMVKTRAKDQYFLTDDDLRGLRHATADNPHDKRNGWPMQLYIVGHIEALSAAKMKHFGTTIEELEDKREDRKEKLKATREANGTGGSKKSLFTSSYYDDYGYYGRGGGGRWY